MILDVAVGNDPSKGKDVDTSKAAWSKARVTAAESRQRIVDTLRAQGNWGMTCKEIANALNVPMHHVSGRCTELIELGILRKTEIARNGGKVLRLV